MILKSRCWSNYLRRQTALPCLAIALFAAADSVGAQVVSDDTVSTRVTSADQLNFLIEDGTRTGNNLFHSFEQFSVPNNGSVQFSHAAEIEHIFSRITGEKISEIDGLIQADSDANLFLLNPNGIRFGEGAELDIGGSFLATTADRFAFDDGRFFSASQPQSPALLSLTVPIGIQFGATAAPIVNQSQALSPDTGLAAGLQVLPGRSLTLLGGEIDFDYGRVTTEGGHVNLGAVAPESLVSLNTDVSQSGAGASPWILGYEQASDFGDILLTNRNSFATDGYDRESLVPSITTSGYPGGKINLQARQIRLDGAGLIADNWSAEPGSNPILLRGSERIILGGDYGSTDSAILSRALDGGRGGQIVLDSPELTLRSISNVYTIVQGTGTGSEVIVNTSELRIEEYGYLGTETYGVGDAGNLAVVANRIWVDQSYLGSNSYGSGQTGKTTITSEELTATDRSEIVNVAYAGGGDVQPVQITVDRLRVLGGAEVGSLAVSGGGNAGPVTIRASEFIDLQGRGEFSDPLLDGELAVTGSAIFSLTDEGEGEGGDIDIETPWLRLAGGTIGANTFSQGDSGDISIRAKRIDISESGFGDPGFQDRFGITNAVERSSTGNGGDISIVTDQLNLFRGGSIASSSLGLGEAGNVSIQARNIDIRGRLEEVPVVGGGTVNQPLPSQIASLSRGEFAAGSVEIQADQITVGDRAEISVSNLGGGDSGLLSIQANRLRLEGRGRLLADVNGGQQGNIDLKIRDVLSLYGNSSITANAMAQSRGGNILIDAGFIISPAGENSDISANAEASFAGNASITTNGLFGIQVRPRLTPLSDITASSQLGVDFTGMVQVEGAEAEPGLQTVDLPETFVDIGQLISAGCALDEDSFVSSGRGGLPKSPANALESDRLWVDMRPGEGRDRQSVRADINSNLDVEATKIQEATEIAIVPDGSPQLIASGSALRLNGEQNSISCTQHDQVR